jgi:elongation factor P--beta-lysine ligase
MFYHPKCEVHLDQLKLLVSKESRRDTTQYYFKFWSNKKQVQITNYPHLYPQLALLQKQIIRYHRVNDHPQRFCQVVELDNGHGDEGDQKMIKCFTFRKEEREKQNPMEIKAKVLLGFQF